MPDGDDTSPWQGRIDEHEGARALRWHQCIAPLPPQASPGIALLGFACDLGVRRNHGRPGAAGGPAALRRALANLAWHGAKPVYDAGDVRAPTVGDQPPNGCESDDSTLEAMQADYAERLAALIDAGHLPIGLGGGHEIAWAAWQGLAAAAARAPRPPRLGVLNLDAHFDLRAAPAGNSGTPFRQIADDCAARGWPFRYACIGLSRAANTRALFQYAAALDVWVREDREITPERLAAIGDDLDAFIADCEYLYVTLDLDVLPAWEAPGVSAPAARGVPLALLEPLLERVRDSGKVKLADIAELNPAYDFDQRTARVAARLVHLLTLNG